ncbi:MAG: gamma-glutamyl-gamma-aminobutyrate hydrolase family protein [Chthoniobacterales bacterium]
MDIGTWLREKDVAYFGKAFADYPDIRLRDARVEEVDINSCNGLLLTGGVDISGEFLSQENIDETQIKDPDPLRDTWEMAAARSAYNRKLPILAICRGLQILNVALGGTLRLHVDGHQHLSDENAQDLHYVMDTPFRFERVNSNHHQCLDRVADPLVVEAIHPPDGIIEQVRIRDYPWGWGMQYHPERHGMYRSIFDAFAKAL